MKSSGRGGMGGGPSGGVSSAGGPWKDLIERYMEKQQRETKKEFAAKIAKDEAQDPSR
jgi:hypothetical protein